MTIRNVLLTSLFFGIVGAALLAQGCGGKKPVSSEPIAVDIADLERGVKPEQVQVIIGPHIALYDGLVYEYETEDPKNKDETKITVCYYPIFSKSNPAVQKHRDDEAKGRALASRLQREAAVVIKTTRYGIVKDLPSDLREEQKVQGRLLNLRGYLSMDDKKSLQKLVGREKADKVLVLQESPATGQ